MRWIAGERAIDGDVETGHDMNVGQSNPVTTTLRGTQGEGMAGSEEMAESNEVKVGAASELTPGKVQGAGRWAVGNVAGEYFAVTRRCRHLYADLAAGHIDDDGCLVCPWHGSKYNVRTGLMVRGPQGIFAKIPGLGLAYKVLTAIIPLRRGEVVKRGRNLYVK